MNPNRTTHYRRLLLASLLLTLVACKNVPQPTESPRPNPAYSASAQPRSSDGFQPRRSRRNRTNAQAAPGEFDYYLLNLSWSPEFCATHNSPECGRGLGFVVHGLWPQNDDGTYPENCSNAPGPSNPQQYTDLIPTTSLIAHEWQTHGTCSGLAAEAYFATIRKADQEVHIPSGIGSGSDASGVSPSQFIARFASAYPSFPAGSILLSCGNNRLTAIEICMTKDLQPEACQNIRSCRANVIQITPQ